MSTQMFLAAVVGPMLLVLGLSVLVYAGVWQKIAEDWAKNHVAMVSMMMFNLIFGLVVINMHNVWEWSPYVVVTVVGWGAFLKAVFYFLVPGDSIKALMKATNNKMLYQGSGLVFAALGGWLSYLAYLM